MLAVHPNACITSAMRDEIAASQERCAVLASRSGVCAETIRKWRKHGPAGCQDSSARPQTVGWKASDEERAIVCALRRATGFQLGGLVSAVSYLLPHLNRDTVYYILKAEGLNRRPSAEQARRPHGAFRDDEVSVIHVDVKYLPKLRDRGGSLRKRYLYVAIDRATRFVHLALKDDETAASAVAFLSEALSAFPIRATQVLNDRGSCFTADAFEFACAANQLQHRQTRLYTPKTNGMVERFNGRVQREVLGIIIDSHHSLETMPHSFNLAYNGRRQRVLKRLSPEMVLRQRLEADPFWSILATNRQNPKSSNVFATSS